MAYLRLATGETAHNVGGITKGKSVTHTLSDGKEIQKVTDVITGTGSMLPAVRFQYR